MCVCVYALCVRACICMNVCVCVCVHAHEEVRSPCQVSSSVTFSLIFDLSLNLPVWSDCLTSQGPSCLCLLSAETAGTCQLHLVC